MHCRNQKCPLPLVGFSYLSSAGICYFAWSSCFGFTWYKIVLPTSCHQQSLICAVRMLCSLEACSLFSSRHPFHFFMFLDPLPFPLWKYQKVRLLLLEMVQTLLVPPAEAAHLMAPLYWHLWVPKMRVGTVLLFSVQQSLALNPLWSVSGSCTIMQIGTDYLLSV